MPRRIKSRKIQIHDRKTCVRLEPEFWFYLRQVAAEQACTAKALIEAVENEVLRVISRSAFNLQAVLTTLTESAARLCVADLGLIFQQDGDVLRLVANFGVSREAERYWLEHPLSVDRSSTTGRALLVLLCQKNFDVMCPSSCKWRDAARAA